MWVSQNALPMESIESVARWAPGKSPVLNFGSFRTSFVLPCRAPIPQGSLTRGQNPVELAGAPGVSP
jgi:hypothetical protein